MNILTKTKIASIETIDQEILLALGLSIFAVFFQWGVWSKGLSALGFNTTIFWIGLLYWVSCTSINRGISFAKEWRWLTPLLLIVFSFSLFENPWLKLISCFILPISFVVFYCYSQISNREEYYWNKVLLNKINLRTVLPLTKIGSSIDAFYYFLLKITGSSNSNSLGIRIGKGILYLLPAAAVVIFLLASADKEFASLVQQLGTYLQKSFNWILIPKIILAYVFTLFLLSSKFAWQSPFAYLGEKTNDSLSKPRLDGVIAGIVILGITTIYALFLYLQIEHLIIDKLPADFSQAELLVKSGFWQLFFLSALNVMLFFIIYKNTNKPAQNLLRLFIVASGLLLLSAAWRISLYVYNYGLSYEKFFASYTTVFALVTFIYLVTASFIGSRKNVFRFVAFSSLWFYGVATVLPIEKIILSSNVALSKAPSSRIELNHLQALSVDVIKDVKNSSDLDWSGWVDKKLQLDCQRNWYEKNLSLLFNCSE